MKDIHEDIKRRLSLNTEAHVGATNARRKDKQFNVGEEIFIQLRLEHFPPCNFKKLHVWHVGPFKVVKKLSYNAYVIGLPSDNGINHIFNIEDLTQFPTMNEQASATMEPPTE